MHRWTDALGYGHGGLVMLVIGLFGAWLANRTSAARYATPKTVRVLTVAAMLSVLAELVFTGVYLFSPSYIDHIEPSIASIALYFQRDVPVFPPLSSYTFHGLLYGPLLAEMSSLGYVLDRSVLGSKLVGWLAGWAAVGLLVISSRRLGRGWPALAALGSALCVLASFGFVLVWNRADPLLFLFAMSALVAVLCMPDLRGLAIAAFLAGAAIDLKVHGFLYVLPALYAWAVADLSRRGGEWLRAALIAIGAGILGVALPLLPANVSLHSYLAYLQLALVHGLRFDLFIWNATFLAGLWLPLCLALAAAPRGIAATRTVSLFAVALFLTELVVTVIGAKPGAGSHHLLPFLGFHAYLLQKLLTLVKETGPRETRAAGIAVVCLIAVLAGMAWSSASAFKAMLTFELRLPEQRLMRAELQRFADRYPGGVMGIANGESYGATFLRPWLTLKGTPQIEFGAFMDLRLSGVSDLPLVRALERCEISHLYMPKAGRPFTIANSYDGRPLFSDEVRSIFAARYTLASRGMFFDVYSCASARR